MIIFNFKNVIYMSIWLFKIKKPEAGAPGFQYFSDKLSTEYFLSPLFGRGRGGFFLFASYCCNSRKYLSFEVFEQCSTSS